MPKVIKEKKGTICKSKYLRKKKENVYVGTEDIDMINLVSSKLEQAKKSNEELLNCYRKGIETIYFEKLQDFQQLIEVDDTSANKLNNRHLQMHTLGLNLKPMDDKLSTMHHTYLKTVMDLYDQHEVYTNTIRKYRDSYMKELKAINELRQKKIAEVEQYMKKHLKIGQQMLNEDEGKQMACLHRSSFSF